jgi:iron(III) transport system permease protein
MNAQNRRLDGALVLGALALLLLPWYSQEAGFFDFGWLTTLWQDQASAPALWQILTFQRPWLAIALLMLLVCALARLLKIGRFRSQLLIAASLVGVVFLLFEGHAIGYSGWNWQWSEHLFGALSDGQPAFGAGAILLITTFLLLFSFALAERGVLKGDAFVVAAIVLLVALVTTFVLYPVLSMFVASVQDVDGSFKPDGLIANMQDPAIWSLSCLKGGSCGTAWRTLTLALMTASGSTLLGLAFALAATRTPLPFKKGLRMLTVLPIITPPFVIGLALMLLFGRAGVVTELLAGVFGIEPGRWLYGLTGIWIAQVLSFTPIAFLVLIGVVEGVSPSLEEASQTLRANRWRTFRYVSLPLMAPGLANAFLISFIESMADFGNPMVLGGSHGVLSTEIFFSVVGAQNDPSRAAVLAIILLCFTLSAFILQRLWLAGKSFATVTGKGDSGTHCGLPRGLRYGVYVLVIPWGLFTLVIYGMILIGGLRAVMGTRQQPDAGPLRSRLRFPLEQRPDRLDRRRLELVLDHVGNRADRRTAHGHRRLAHRLADRAAEVCRSPDLRVYVDAQLCHPRHGDWRQLHHGLQSAAAGNHRHRPDPGRLLCVPQYAGRRSGWDRRHESVGSQPG